MGYLVFIFNIVESWSKNSLDPEKSVPKSPAGRQEKDADFWKKNGAQKKETPSRPFSESVLLVINNTMDRPRRCKWYEIEKLIICCALMIPRVLHSGPKH